MIDVDSGVFEDSDRESGINFAIRVIRTQTQTIQATPSSILSTKQATNEENRLRHEKVMRRERFFGEGSKIAIFDLEAF